MPGVTLIKCIEKYVFLFIFDNFFCNISETGNGKFRI